MLFLKYVFGWLIVTQALWAAEVSKKQQVVNIYNWSHFITPEAIKSFETKTGIKVNYDVYDAYEILETKIVSGQSGYDLVFPSVSMGFKNHAKQGLYQPLNQKKLSNLKHLDPIILSQVADYDPGHNYIAPYLWGFTLLAYDAAALPATLKTDSWGLLFDPNQISQIKKPIGLLDDAAELFPHVLAYQGKSPQNTELSTLLATIPVLQSIRPYIHKFSSSQFYTDLAEGNLALSTGWSGEIRLARDLGKKYNRTIKYFIPKEGASMWIEGMAIPKDAINVDAAHQFINHLLDPKVIAQITESIGFANANKTSLTHLSPKTLKDPLVYPSAQDRKRLFLDSYKPPAYLRRQNRLWTQFKTNLLGKSTASIPTTPKPPSIALKKP
jgi:putrescine transport system substrate-binding protein